MEALSLLGMCFSWWLQLCHCWGYDLRVGGGNCVIARFVSVGGGSCVIAGNAFLLGV